MNEIRCKRIYDAPEETDGFRVLIDRLWSRGVKKETAHIDLWAKEIAPSAELRKWFGHEPERFEPFSKLYAAELGENPAAEGFVATVCEELTHGNVTLLYAARDVACNHAVVLRDWLRKEKSK